MLEYIIVKTEEEYKAAVQLFKEYAQWLNIDLNFQHFNDELENLKLMYNDNDGGIILGKENDQFIACVAVRRNGPVHAELKRMYVQPAHQHKGIGKGLLKKAIALAKYCNYNMLRLDTLDHMTPAINLYKKYGFYQTVAYYNNPLNGVVYFELEL